MLGTDYIPIKLFVERHNANKGSMEVFKSRGRYPKEAFAKSGGALYVNEYWFIEQKEYQVYVKMFNQDMYYWMREFYATDKALVKELQLDTKDINVQQYLGDELWRAVSDDVIYTTISPVEQQVFNAFKRIDRFIKRAYPSWDVKYILDKRMSS